MNKKAEVVKPEVVEEVVVLSVEDTRRAELVKKYGELETVGIKRDKFIESNIGKLGLKDVFEFWSLFGAKGKKGGFRFKFYAELKKGNLTHEEVKKFAEDRTTGSSDNDIKQYLHYATIADLVREVRADLTEELTEEVKK